VYYMVISFSRVCMVFSGVVSVSHGLLNMSGEYGVRIRWARVNLGVCAGAWNYGAIIVTIRDKNENIKTYRKLKSDVGFRFPVLDCIYFDYSFVKIRSGMNLLPYPY